MMDNVQAEEPRPALKTSGTGSHPIEDTQYLKSMRICMIGLRGIPDVQGGVEKHVEQLVSNLVNLGADVHVFARKNYVAGTGPYNWHGITVHPLWAPRSTRLEAILHTALALWKARLLDPDIVHIHAVGPSLVAPLARLLGLKVVFTHHGYDYDREKWNSFEKRILRLGEWTGMRFSHARIAIAKHIAERMQKDFNEPVYFIPNGVKVDTRSLDNTVLTEFGLEKRRYILLVARLVAEKRQLDLIEAFTRAKLKNTKLVLVGGGDVGSEYARELQMRALADPRVILTGTQSGHKLGSLFANAGLFVLPSSHEGMPIALLEAMAHDLPVLASDIEANLGLGLDDASYFPLGNIDALTAALQRKLESQSIPRAPTTDSAKIVSKYDWQTISLRTAEIYRSISKVKARRTVSQEKTATVDA